MSAEEIKANMRGGVKEAAKFMKSIEGAYRDPPMTPSDPKAKKAVERSHRKILEEEGYSTQCDSECLGRCRVCPDEAVRAAMLRARNEAIEGPDKIVSEWLMPQELELRAGEMTAQEKRTVKAVLISIQSAIRQLKDKT